MERLLKDPRHFQILTLGGLLGLLVIWSDFAPDFLCISLTMASALLTQVAFTKFYKLPAFDFRSPLITSLSLCLLLKGGALWIPALAGFAAIASKFLIRREGKHIFNPANFAIVTGLILLPDLVWVSPGQWGSAVWLGFFLIGMAVLVLGTARRGDMSFFFMLSWAAIIFGRALWLGDPLTIPVHQMQSGALLIFAFFMISDPKTTPDHILGRFIFAAVTAALAATLQFIFEVREALFYALFVVCLTTPFIDEFLKSERYQWGKA